MRIETRKNEQGWEYTQSMADYGIPEAYVPFACQEDKDKTIGRINELYEKGKLIRGKMRDGQGGFCALGVMERLGLLDRMVDYPAQAEEEPWSRVLIGLNDAGWCKAQDAEPNTVLPSSHAEVIQYLKECPILLGGKHGDSSS